MKEPFSSTQRIRQFLLGRFVLLKNEINKYFELKNSWGARAPLNLELLASNFPMYVQ